MNMDDIKIENSIENAAAVNEMDNTEAAVLENVQDLSGDEQVNEDENKSLEFSGAEQESYQQAVEVRLQDRATIDTLKDMIKGTAPIVGGVERDLPVEGQGSSCGRGAGCSGSHWCGGY